MIDDGDEIAIELIRDTESSLSNNLFVMQQSNAVSDGLGTTFMEAASDRSLKDSKKLERNHQSTSQQRKQNDSLLIQSRATSGTGSKRIGRRNALLGGH